MTMKASELLQAALAYDSATWIPYHKEGSLECDCGCNEGDDIYDKDLQEINEGIVAVFKQMCSKANIEWDL